MNRHWVITLQFHDGTDQVNAVCEGITFVPDGTSQAAMQEWVRRYVISHGGAPEGASVAFFSAEPAGA